MQNPDSSLFAELEKVELAEELFGIDLPVDLALDDPRELFDYLIVRLRGWGPNRRAAHFLQKLATKRENPILAERLDGAWRREQVSAVIQEVFNIDEHASGEDGAGIPVMKPRRPKSGGRAAALNPNSDPGKQPSR